MQLSGDQWLRWWKGILEQEEAIRVTLSADRKISHLVPTWQDINVLQVIHTALSPLSSLTDILSAESYVSVCSNSIATAD